MILIFGGVYQGKLAYVQQTYGVSADEVHYCTEVDTEIESSKKVIYEVDKWLYARCVANVPLEESILALLSICENKIIICNDISQGVVPVDGLMRAWREAVGRLMGRLSVEAEEVVRVYVGIPSRLK